MSAEEITPDMFPCDCYWCDDKIVNKSDAEELPLTKQTGHRRGLAHKKCAEEFYLIAMADDNY